MRNLLKSLLFFIVGTVVSARITGLIVARQRDMGSEASDEFRRAVVMYGVGFTSRAGGLRSGEISVLMGSARLDLREATLDPRGAELTLDNTMGSLQVLVRDDWAVTVDDTLVGGGDVEIDVTSPDDLAEDAPKLHIQLLTRMGGSVVSTGDQDS